MRHLGVQHCRSSLLFGTEVGETLHGSSFDNMRRCIKRHVVSDAGLCARRPLQVLDVGGADVNGSYRPLFGFMEHRYVAADIDADSTADVLIGADGVIPVDDRSVDVVVCGQTFEHAARFWQLFDELVRVLASDGVLILIAPSAGPVHRYPVDCYRFHPDSFQALADLHDLHLVELRVDDRGPFRDVVGVFRKEPAAGGVPADADEFLEVIDGALQNDPPAAEISQVEYGSGTMPALQFLRRLHAQLAPRFYLEIGVFDGASLHRARCPSIGIDPVPNNRFELRADQTIHSTLSVDFFASPDRVAKLGPLDLVYIDGMHLIENAFEDFINVERHAHATSVILIDDIFPNHPVQARRRRVSRHWTGDVWKIIDVLRYGRPDLIVLPVDTSPTGTLVVIGADPTNREFWNGFDVIVGDLVARDEDPPETVLARKRALAPDDPLLARVFRMLVELREIDDPSAGMDRVRRLVRGALPRKVAAS